MKPRIGSWADLQRLRNGMPGKVLKFTAQKLKGRENIKGAKRQANEDAALKFNKEPRSIARYLKSAMPLQDINFVAGAGVDLLRDPSVLDPVGKKATLKSIREVLAMLSFIQKHLTVAERDRFSHLAMNDVYDIARIKAGKSLTRKSKIVDDRK